MRVVLAAARSSPGVTTAAVALASVWPGRVRLVEASEDGGVLAARFGLRLDPGATTLAAAARRDADPVAIDSHCQSLPGTDGRVSVLVGPAAAEAAHTLWRTAGDRLARLLASLEDATVIVDAGRLPASPATAPLIATADRFLLLTRPRVEDLQALAVRLPVLQELGTEPEVLLVGRDPYSPEEVASTLGCRVVGVLADDRKAADGLSGLAPARRLDRSLLVRSAASLVDALEGTPEPAAPLEGTSSWTASTLTASS